MEEKNPRVQRGSDRARTENRSGGSPRRGEKAPRANGNENGQGNKKTRTYKHVQLEHKRPQLSKAGEGGQRAASNRGDQSARRNFASPKKDPNATLKIIRWASRRHRQEHDGVRVQRRHDPRRRRPDVPDDNHPASISSCPTTPTCWRTPTSCAASSSRTATRTTQEPSRTS